MNTISDLDLNTRPAGAGVSLPGSVIEIVFLRLIFLAKFLESRIGAQRVP
jgi:hypothetical protein